MEYALRSTHTGVEVMHAFVKATKQLSADFKGNLIPLGEDKAFADEYGCDIETAQRCRLVEIVNQYVLADLPSGRRVRDNAVERHIISHPEYINLNITPDGSVEMLKDR